MTKKKILVLASVASMIDQFNMQNIRLLIQLGYEVHTACNFKEGNTCSQSRICQLKERLSKMGVSFYQIDFKRNICQVFAHGKAYRQLCAVLNKNTYAFVHCHSPIGGVIGRIAAWRYGVPVLYTVHGFHFYKGAPVKNWLLYYPIEWLLSWHTQLLITINREDFVRAKAHLHAKKTVYVPGTGVDMALFGADRFRYGSNGQTRQHRPFVFLHTAEFIKRKNHKTVLRALCQIEKDDPNRYDYQYILCGIGPEEKKLKRFVKKHGLSHKVRFLGYRSDIPQLLCKADACMLSSYQEGLPVAVMEAMAAGLPVIASRIRGNSDLIDAQGGFLVDTDNPKDYAQAMVWMMECKHHDPEKLLDMGKYNREKSRVYDTANIRIKMKKIYEDMGAPAEAVRNQNKKIPQIKILVACHKESFVPRHKMLYAIQTGTQLAEANIHAAYYDNEGVHISEKNKSYCELTAQYWAWKNLDADYYGFFHYRRYLSFAKEYPVRENGKPDCRSWRPYIERKDLKTEWKLCALSEEAIGRIAEKYDLVTALREPMDCTVYEHYCQFHQESDLKKMLRIVMHRHPEYQKAVSMYMRSHQIFFTNMYLMSKKEFFSYMEWLFPMLEEFEAKTDFSKYTGQECRVTGYLAERLFGIYYTHAVFVRKIRCCELQYVIFSNTNPWESTPQKEHGRLRTFCPSPLKIKVTVDMRKVNMLLPPGSARRIAVRRLFRKIL